MEAQHYSVLKFGVRARNMWQNDIQFSSRSATFDFCLELSYEIGSHLLFNHLSVR